MDLKLISGFRKSRYARDRLLVTLAQTGSGPHIIHTAHGGGQSQCPGFYFPREDVWFILDYESDDSRFWNPAGVGDPRTNSSNTIIIEFNPPTKVRNAHVQGAFAKDGEGNVYLVHRGRLGGRHTATTGADLWSQYSIPTAQMQDGKRRVVEVGVVGRIDDHRFQEGLGRYVRAVAHLKSQS